MEGGSTEGLTKREYFAAMAMQGILASDPSQLLGYDTIAHNAVLAADHLMNALNKEVQS